MIKKTGYNPPRDDSRTNPAKPEPSRRKRNTRFPFPSTSREAYEMASPGRGLVYKAILHLLAVHGPLVDDELYRRYLEAGYPVCTRQWVATARGVLRDVGLVVDTGERGRSNLGNPAKLWAVAAEVEVAL